MLPGMLHLIECMERCLSNSTCKSVNFETGLCVLLSSSASERPEALTLSQFPVFTIYAQKICLTGNDKKKLIIFSTAVNFFFWSQLFDMKSCTKPEISEIVLYLFTELMF